MSARRGLLAMLLGGVFTFACVQGASVAHDHTVTWPTGIAPCDPAAAELCNGHDDDCDGAIDEESDCSDPCRAVALGDSCLLRNDGAVFCWGAYTGDPHGFYARTPTRMPLAEPAVQLTAGCARTVSGRVACWGGFTPQNRPPSYLARLGNTSAAILSLAGAPSGWRCARRNGRLAGSLWCWPFGEAPIADESPQPVPGLHEAVVEVAVGLSTCTRKATGEIFCTEPGGNPLSLKLVPALGRDNLGLASGPHVCVLKADGRVVCLGPPFCPADNLPRNCSSLNLNGELGTGTTEPATTPIVEAVALGEGITKVVVRDRETCARDRAGRVTCVGRSRLTAYSPPPRDARAWPRTPAGLESDVVDLSTDCAIKGDGSVWCWGDGAPDGAGARARPDPVRIDLCPEAGPR